MPGRVFNTGTYAYGFNGKRKDNETYGEGNAYDFGNRIYDPRIGRWLSTDRYESKYPAWSPYVSMLSNPLAYTDIKGDTIELIIGKPYTDASGEEHEYGHVSLRVYNAKEGYDKIYDFGRYGKTWDLGMRGEGILNVYEDGDAFIKNEMKFRSSVGYIQPTSVQDDKKILAHFEELTKGGVVFNGGAVPGGGGTAYKLEESYKAQNNNCCTKSLDALSGIGINWMPGEYDPRDALKKMEKGYKDEYLTRTEYNKGGEVKMTYQAPTKPKIKPMSKQFSEFLKRENNYPNKPDNTGGKRIVRPEVVKPKTNQ